LFSTEIFFYFARLRLGVRFLRRLSMIKICEHIKTNGEPCGSPALTERDYCYFHNRFNDLNDMPGAPDYLVPVLEDHLSVQLFIMQIAKAQACRSINPEQAKFMLDIARTAMSNLRHTRPAGK
jgi:hypothetical protein